jgi:hypothetical protein
VFIYNSILITTGQINLATATFSNNICTCGTLTHGVNHWIKANMICTCGTSNCMEAACLKGAYDAASLTGNIHVDRLPASAKCGGTVTSVSGGTGLSSTGGTTPSISLDIATGSSLGGVKFGCGCNQTTAANTFTETANRTYSVTPNSTNQMLVNVPWTDTTNFVQSVTAGTGLSGGTITSTGTISLPNTGPGAASHGHTGNSCKIDTITLDAQGRVTAVNLGPISSGTVGATSVCGSWTTPSCSSHDFCVATSRCISGPVICANTLVKGATVCGTTAVCGTHHGDGSNLTGTASICTSADDVLAATNCGAISAVSAGVDKLVYWRQACGCVKYLTFDDLAPLPA